MPSKLGGGPDKNHSYHQNIEAGKNMFFSTYFMALVIQQPEALEYDENLIKAQTIGTVKSIIRKNRKVVLLVADSTIEEAESDVDEFFRRAGEYLEFAKSISLTLDKQGSTDTEVVGVPPATNSAKLYFFVPLTLSLIHI